jgi:hypothetical protein
VCAEENKKEGQEGFRVVDRRGTAETTSPDPRPVDGPGWQMREEKRTSPLPPIDFTTFCLSLANSAMIHLGLAPDPESGQGAPNLPLAQQTIDILAMLEDKTRNNLTADESKLLSALLYDLRMRFVEARGATS